MNSVTTSPEATTASSLGRGTKVAVLFHRFGPYHHARLNAAGKLMQVTGVEACGMEDTYAWSKVEGAAAFTRITLTDRDADNRQWKRIIQQKMRLTLSQIKPDVVVIPGWAAPDALSALEWCAETQTPAIMMSESTEWDEPRKPWKEWLKRRIVGLCSAGLVGGTPHAEYLAQLGMKREKISLGYDAVDNEHFAINADKFRNTKRGSGTQCAENNRFQDMTPYFLASARYIEKKNLLRLIEAYARYRGLAKKRVAKPTDSDIQKLGSENQRSDILNLVLLGDGPLKTELKDLISDLGLQDSVLMPGFKQYDELPAYYGFATAFIHASTTEQWGLVVNEAMASGLPVVVSKRCGCAADLVREGVNGFTFDPYDVDQLAGLMQRISDIRFPLSEFGHASQNIIAEWGPERFASGMSTAVETALLNRPVKLGLLDRLLLQALGCK